jgi:hypothetical protein
MFLMHDDAVGDAAGWESYLAELQKVGAFQGGSEIGEGICARKSGSPSPISSHLTGFIRVSADSIEHAQALLAGNPVFEAGGTIEIRELSRSD